MMNFLLIEQGKYQSVLESGDQGQLKDLLSAVPSMPEHEVKFLMFSASFPNVSKPVFKSVVQAVLIWGDRHRRKEKKHWATLRKNPEAFGEAIYWAIMDNYIVDLMDARLTQKEIEEILTDDNSPLFLAVDHKRQYGNPSFPEHAVLRYLTSRYAFDSDRLCTEYNVTVWHLACHKALSLDLINILANDTRYKTVNIRDTVGDTPLHKLCGASPCQPDADAVATLLISKGVDPLIKANDGKTCIDILRENLALTPSSNGEALLNVLNEATAMQGGADHA